jgi:phosphomannomutase
MLTFDHLSHLPIADDQIDPLDFPAPSTEQLVEATEQMILSASGWRKIFAASGDEEDKTTSVSDTDAILASLAALALARHLGVPGAGEKAIDSAAGTLPPPPEPAVTVLVGLDARPTGQVLGDIVCRTLSALGVTVRYLFVCAAPEIMADCNLFPSEADAFLYISASHNPIGHNGIKFGKAGGVYSGKESALLADTFRSLVGDPDAAKYVQRLSALLDTQTYRKVIEATRHQKQQSLQRYENFVLGTACKSFDPASIRKFSQSVLEESEKRPIGIVAELNGSARSTSIDYSLFKSLGIKTMMLNNQIGKIVHAIVPEGENLELCRKTLEEAHRRDPSFLLGYVPDNDGDRGNLTYIRETTGQACIMEAQEVFALVALSELCQARLSDPDKKIAIAVNGPTSMRIDRICENLEVSVFRSEVGEANVVELAAGKRAEGYLVPILGEGSNGGNITFPSKVRDPLNTLMSLVKLLSDRSVFRLWCMAIGKEAPQQVTLEAIMDSLPRFTSTGSFSPEAKMQARSSQRALKNAYEEIFPKEWDLQRERLRSLGIEGYEIHQTEGIVCRKGAGEGNRNEPYKGGYKVVLLDRENRPTDFLWMRGSGTEPVFRVMVDCEGNDRERHDFLLAWHRKMIGAADEMAAARDR